MRIFAIASLILLVIVIPMSEALSATVEVTIDENGFNPPGFTIQKGDTVRWTNNGTTDHSVTSGSNGVADGYIDSGLLKPGEKFEFTFMQPAPFSARIGYFDKTDLSKTGGVSVLFSVAISPGNSVLMDSESLRLFIFFFLGLPYEPEILVSYDGNLIFQGSLQQFMGLGNGILVAELGSGVVITIPPYTMPVGVHTLSISVVSPAGEVVASDKVVYTVLQKGEIVNF